MAAPIRRLRPAWRLLGLALCLACGRSDSGGPGVRIAAVTSTRTTFSPGEPGIAMFAVITNDQSHAMTIHECALAYRGAGDGFASERVGELGVVAPGSSLAVEFRVRLPANGSGSAVVDASAVVLNTDEGVSLKLNSADSPLAVTYVDAADWPSFEGLPVLVVTTHEDEIDGGVTVSAVAEAGGEADLSLREALAIVQNQGVPSRITFDSTLFDAAHTEPIIIPVASGALPALTVAGTVIDGLGLAVSLDTTAGCCPVALEIRAPRVVLRGLSFFNFYRAVNARDASDLLISDVSFTGTDNDLSWAELMSCARAVVRRVMVTTRNATSVAADLRVVSSPDVRIESSLFSIHAGIELESSPGSVVRDNVTSRRVSVLNSARVHLHNNLVTGYCEQIYVSGASEGTLLTDNTVDRNCGRADAPLDADYAAIRVNLASPVTLSRNRVMHVDRPIYLENGANAGASPPTIELASTTMVAGTSSAADGSLVEVFSDPTGSLAAYVASATVQGGAFTVPISVSSSDQVRVTVTDLEGRTSEASAPFLVP